MNFTWDGARNRYLSINEQRMSQKRARDVSRRYTIDYLEYLLK